MESEEFLYEYFIRIRDNIKGMFEIHNNHQIHPLEFKKLKNSCQTIDNEYIRLGYYDKECKK